MSIKSFKTLVDAIGTGTALLHEYRMATAKAAEPKGHQRDGRGTPGRTSDPLAVHIVPRLPRKVSE